PRPHGALAQADHAPAARVHGHRQRLRAGVEQRVAMPGLVRVETVDERGRVLIEAALAAPRVEEDADVQSGRSPARATATTCQVSSVMAAPKSKPPNQPRGVKPASPSRLAISWTRKWRFTWVSSARSKRPSAAGSKIV